MNDISPWMEVAKTFGYPVAMAGFLLFWSFIRDRRSDRRDSVRESRMWEEIKKSREKTIEVSEGTIARNTEALEGMKNYLNHVGNVVQGDRMRQQEWIEEIKKCHDRSAMMQEFTPNKQRAVKEEDVLVS